jgi:hypothetical protein
MYLNAQVYIGTPKQQNVWLSVEVIAGVMFFKTNYLDNFKADNPYFF